MVVPKKESKIPSIQYNDAVEDAVQCAAADRLVVGWEGTKEPRSTHISISRESELELPGVASNQMVERITSSNYPLANDPLVACNANLIIYSTGLPIETGYF